MTLIQAADILRKSRPDLSLALRELLPQYSDAPARLYRRKRQPHKVQLPLSSAMANKSTSMSVSHSADSSQLTQSESFQTNDQDSSIMCTVPSFGFGLTLPKQIAECFASFTPPVPEPCMSMLEKATHSKARQLLKEGT